MSPAGVGLYVGRDQSEFRSLDGMAAGNRCVRRDCGCMQRPAVEEEFTAEVGHSACRGLLRDQARLRT